VPAAAIQGPPGPLSPDAEQVRTWALVLDSQGVPYRVEREGDDWQLVVHPRDAQRAAAALAAYTAENAPAPVQRRPVARAWAVGAVGTAVALILFALVTGPWTPGSVWFAAGEADGSLIQSGQLWRTVTALTLHADLGHVLANALGVALFGGALGSVLGPGVALVLMLVAGAVGNGLDVLIRSAPYEGVGASTAVFGAVGLLAGIQVAEPWADAHRRRMALLAGFLLLVLLGMGQQSDVLAHILGSCVGVPMGVAAAKVFRQPPAWPAQLAWAAAALALVLWAWWLALGNQAGAAGPGA
jgi:rhomboid protease GluP